MSIEDQEKRLKMLKELNEKYPMEGFEIFNFVRNNEGNIGNMFVRNQSNSYPEKEKYTSVELAKAIVSSYDDTYCWTSLHYLECDIADKYGINPNEVHSFILCLIDAAREVDQEEWRETKK